MEKDLSVTELVVLLPEELLDKTTPVRGAGKSNIDPLREAPQHCIVQVLRKLGTLDQLYMGVKCCPVLNILLWVSILHLYFRF